MTDELKDYIVLEVKKLISAPSVCKQAKEVSLAWLNGLNTSDEKKLTIELVNELKEDLESIDDLLEFTRSPLIVKLFGKEKAKIFAEHAEELKKSGAKYCDCPACVACNNILKHEKELLS